MSPIWQPCMFLMKNDVVAKITFLSRLWGVRWNSRAPAVLLCRSVEKSVDARCDGFPDSAQVGPSGSGNLSPFGNGFKFCSRTFSTGLLGDIIFPSVSGKTWTSFQLFLLDSSEITKSLYFLPFAKSSKKGKVTSFVKPPRMDTDSIHKETFIYSWKNGKFGRVNRSCEYCSRISCCKRFVP